MGLPIGAPVVELFRWDFHTPAQILAVDQLITGWIHDQRITSCRGAQDTLISDTLNTTFYIADLGGDFKLEVVLIIAAILLCQNDGPPRIPNIQHSHRHIARPLSHRKPAPGTGAAWANMCVASE